uniref:Biogenesis of lysosome-related organelles complex 1 subunit 6 n=1 Tax=Myotis lucifugus TaxID=59463 RepID=G1PY62_MYOLU
SQREGHECPWAAAVGRGPGRGAGERTPGLSDTSPDGGLTEDLPVEDKAVEPLAEALLSHYLLDLQRSKQALQELMQNHEQEVSKFKECHSVLDINALFTEAKHVHAKLVNIRKEILVLHKKTSNLKKKKSTKLQQKRQKEELEREQQGEEEFEREKQLTEKPFEKL